MLSIWAKFAYEAIVATTHAIAAAPYATSAYATSTYARDPNARTTFG